MELHRSPSISGVAFLLLSVFLLHLGPCQAFNITKILDGHPSLSTFNHYLSVTHLASDINSRATITVLSLDNAAMDSLLAQQFSLPTLRNILALHILVDYYSASKLHGLPHGSTRASTIFQASGSAPGTSGFVNITSLGRGQVGFAPEENSGRFNSTFVKAVVEMPFNISVLQISQPLTSPEAEAPAAAPSFNLTEILGKGGCKAFSDLLKSSGAESAFEENVESGLTMFCPSDAAITAFSPKYKNLTKAEQTSLLLYHGIPFYQSLQNLKTGNGRKETLATTTSDSYGITVQNNGTTVNLMTKINTAKITTTLVDENPLAVYVVDHVLKPKELFAKDAPTPAPAPAPSKKKKKAAASPEAESPDASADEEDDTSSKKNAASLLVNTKFAALIALLFLLAV